MNILKNKALYLFLIFSGLTSTTKINGMDHIIISSPIEKIDYLAPLKALVKADDAGDQDRITKAFNGTFDLICAMAIRNPAKCLRILESEEIKREIAELTRQLTEQINQRYSSAHEFIMRQTVRQAFSTDESFYWEHLWNAISNGRNSLLNKIAILAQLLKYPCAEYFKDIKTLQWTIQKNLFWKELANCTIL